MSKPLISVVLPTRNRASLLPLAIRSVLDQTQGDLELIVSDNHSDDLTGEVACSFNDPRIRYVRSEKPLSIGDSYELALSHAAGEYISFISDDDAYTPILLERSLHALKETRSEVMTYRFAGYYHDEDRAMNRRIAPETLAFPAFTGEITEFSVVEARTELFRRFGLAGGPIDRNFVVSFLSNSIYRRSIFDRIREKKSRLFDSVPSDMYVGGSLLFVIKKYCCLDLPLYVWSSWAENITASPSKVRNSLRERYERLMNGRELEFTPLKFALPANCTADVLLRVQKDFGEGERGFDPTAYFLHMSAYLSELASKGVDVSSEMSEFRQTLDEQSADVGNEVSAILGSLGFRVKQFARKSDRLVRAAKAIMRVPGEQYVLLSGRKEGFHDVLDAARVLSARIEQEIPLK